jgi:hypothetical protein
LTLVPHPSTWFGDHKGALAYQQLSGDFVATVRVVVADRAADAGWRLPVVNPGGGRRNGLQESCERRSGEATAGAGNLS